MTNEQLQIIRSILKQLEIKENDSDRIKNLIGDKCWSFNKFNTRTALSDIGYLLNAERQDKLVNSILILLEEQQIENDLYVSQYSPLMLAMEVDQVESSKFDSYGVPKQ